MDEPLERIYVKVTSEFDETGYVKPCSITWGDGRKFEIDEVISVHPGSTIANKYSNMKCYDVMIGGEKRRLFFTKTNPDIFSTLGRWFVERPACNA